MRRCPYRRRCVPIAAATDMAGTAPQRLPGSTVLLGRGSRGKPARRRSEPINRAPTGRLQAARASEPGGETAASVT
jgi:hypothetical protein